ncbi:M14 family zinc carboxypeptidase [Immundisolibacter cernigliae]|uniref:Peptidase M14 domain-containing protein n=1 Tax=Immundisolibacter cernigliae TaxID=1810504 RepID=A0A1B1YUX2_9GAMM|nr:M14 family zinc carboxypeptidase [Immundisolibacter cernigliae]ANX04670.1 hypothetical protein PG2T_11185 [Immundisolibacter cernigliae]
MPLPTPLEAQAFGRYSDSAQIAAYLRALAVASGGTAVFGCAGHSALGREIPVLTCGVADPARVEDGKLRLLLVGSVHGASEAAGCEALLCLARSVLLGELRELLDVFELVLIPNANPDGRDADSFRNGNRVNINRDFVLLEQPESRALDAAVRRYAPAVVLDAHESAVLKRRTLGQEGYLTAFEAQFDVASTPAIPAALRDFATDTLLPQLIAGVQARGLHAQRYIAEIRSVSQPITHGGLTLRMFRNKAGLRGPLTVLLETPMEPKAGQYATYRDIGPRVHKQLLCMRVFLDCVRASAPAIRAAQARAALELDQPTCALNGSYLREPPDAAITLPLRERASGTRVQSTFADHRTVIAQDTLRIPPHYFVTEHTEVFAELLARHGAAFERLAQAIEAPVMSEVFAGGGNPEAACQRIDELTHRRLIPAGALRVPLSGSNRRLVPLLLEPRSTSSVFRYPAFAGLLQHGRPFFIPRGVDEN